MSLDKLLDLLWRDYSSMNKQAQVIHDALEKRGERVVNDHIAFRTFDHPKVSIEVMAAPFINHGYKLSPEPEYQFPEKKLRARYYLPPAENLPKVFISALRLEECSDMLHRTVLALIDQVPSTLVHTDNFLVSGKPWKAADWKTYQDLLKESEYAAWLAAFGFRVNHFTVLFNALKTFKELADLNEFIKKIGFELNAAGGEVKGSKAVYLEQSSTLAYPVPASFADRKETIPACYYEFARRYPMPDGKLFQGFIPDSANKIFESTDYKQQKTENR